MSEARDRLGVSRSTLWRWLRAGRMPPARRIGPKGVRLQPFIDSETRAATALERARAKNPEKAEELENLRDLEQIYEMSLNGVRAGILEELPAAMEIRTKAEG